MAAPSYTTDLTTINNGESGTWVEMTGWANGGTPQVNTTEWYIQGSGCVTASMNNKTTLQSIAFNNGSDISSSFSTGDCVFMWQVCLAGGSLQTNANGGLRLIVGDTQSTFNAWITGGSDYSPNPYGGWKNVAVDPTYTADYTVGSPGTGYQYFGSGLLAANGVQKGEMHCVDIIRYGRGELKYENGDSGNGYATFAGAATQNDNNSNRWGLFQEIAGGYLWKGLMSLGTSTNAVDFRDSNRNITIDDTPRTYADFNKIVISNEDSNVEWTGINFTAVDADGLSVGRFESLEGATLTIDTCVFTDMDTFVFDTTADINVITDSTWRRCNEVTQGLASFTDCVFDASDSVDAAVLASDIDLISGCSFISSGSGHGIELDSNHAGGSYSLTNVTFTDYATVDGTTGNECILNNSGGEVTINVSGGTFPTIMNGVDSTTIVQTSVTLKMTVTDENGDPINGAYAYIDDNDSSPYIMNTTTNASGIASTSYGGGSVTDSRWRVRKYGYKPYKQLVDIASSDISIPVTLIADPQQT